MPFIKTLTEYKPNEPRTPYHRRILRVERHPTLPKICAIFLECGHLAIGVGEFTDQDGPIRCQECLETRN